MSKEAPIKKEIDLSSFLCDLYNIQFRLNALIIELEKLEKESLENV